MSGESYINFANTLSIRHLGDSDNFRESFSGIESLLEGLNVVEKEVGLPFCNFSHSSLFAFKCIRVAANFC